MGDINCFSVSGRVVREPKIGQYPKGGLWVSMRIASNIDYYDPEKHAYDTRPQFFDCLCRLYQEDDPQWYKDNIVTGTQIVASGQLVMETRTVKGTDIFYMRPYVQADNIEIGQQPKRFYSAQRWTPPAT